MTVDFEMLLAVTNIKESSEFDKRSRKYSSKSKNLPITISLTPFTINLTADVIL